MQTLSIRSVTPQLRGCERIMDDKLNKLYTEFIGKNVQTGITADNFDILRRESFITPENKQYFDDLIRIARISNQMSASGPIPGTMRNATTNATSSGTQYTIWSPSIGEVWQVCGAFSTSGSGLSGTVFLEVKLRDQVNLTTVEIISTSTTSGTDVPMTETTQNPIYVDENMALQVEATGTFSSITFAVPLIRVR